MDVDPLDPSVTEALRGWRVQHSAGVEAARALETSAELCRDTRARSSFLAAGVHAAKGDGFPVVLKALAPVFSEAERAVFLAGWNSGRFDTVLQAIEAQRDLWYHSRSKIRAGLLLPVAVLIGAVFVAPLPALFVTGDLFMYLLSALTPLVIAFLIYHAGNRALHARARELQSSGPSTLDTVLLDLPVVGEVEKARNLSEIFSLLSIQLAAGVPIVAAVETTARCAANGHYRVELARTAAAVRQGQPLSITLAGRKLWPQELVVSIAVGEKSGALDEVLARLSTHCQQRYVSAIQAMSTWLPKIAYLLVALYMIFQIAMLAGRIGSMYSEVLK